MTTTTDFQAWADSGNAPEDFEAAYELYRASLGEKDRAYYKVSTKDGALFITGKEGTLALMSDKAIHAFQKFIERYKDDPNESWEGWHESKRLLAKDAD